MQSRLQTASCCGIALSPLTRGPLWHKSQWVLSTSKTNRAGKVLEQKAWYRPLHCYRHQRHAALQPATLEKCAGAQLPEASSSMLKAICISRYLLSRISNGDHRIKKTTDVNRKVWGGFGCRKEGSSCCVGRAGSSAGWCPWLVLPHTHPVALTSPTCQSTDLAQQVTPPPRGRQ